MVNLSDGEPVVKVIDFGMAKATVHRLTERTLLTACGQMIGTPAYMSPEQAAGHPGTGALDGLQAEKVRPAAPGRRALGVRGGRGAKANPDLKRFRAQATKLLIAVPTSTYQPTEGSS
jgi:serine/threonine protein kinase